MKRILLIATLFLLGFNLTNILTVKADTASFHEAEYVDGIYIRYRSGNTIYYQKARFFRRNSDNAAAYCLEPFIKINESAVYEGQISPTSISSATWKRLSLIAHFGYNYANHTDPKWYAVTQFMIWQEVEPSANFQFTDTLNGNTINAYQNEINEINSLINAYQTKPSFDNNTITLVEGKKHELIDTNNVINNYSINQDGISISNNKLIISFLKEGEYSINIDRNERSNDPPIFYYNNSSQKLMTAGGVDGINSKLNIKVLSTSINLKKIDYDTKDSNPSGEGILIGASYDLFDSNMNKIDTLVIDENYSASYKNLAFGKYYLKEVTAGTGYTLDPNTYEFNIDSNNKDVYLTLENEIVKKKITIIKKYGNSNSFSNEEAAKFEIYDLNNNLIETITTDSLGVAEVILPFGKYTFKQISTKDGFNKVDDFEVIISDSSEDKLEYELFDYEVKVPYTYNSNKDISLLLILFLSLFFRFNYA